MPIVIRPETPADLDAIYQVNRLAFGQTQEADLVDALRAAQVLVISLVAVQDAEVVGHIAFSPVQLESSQQTIQALGLAPMAVKPVLQRQGIGGLLVNAGLAACRKQGCKIIVVLGHPEYYSRFGFVPATHFGLRCEYSVPDEFFMAQLLTKADLPLIFGLVRYHRAFEAVSAEDH